MSDVFLPLMLEGRYLLVEARHVQVILGSVTVTPIPHANLRLPGVFPHGHRALPLVDLCTFLELPVDGPRDRPRTVIMRVGEETVGVQADRVLEVVRLSESDLRAPHALPGRYAKAESQLDGRTVTVVDVERLVSDCLPEAN